MDTDTLRGELERLFELEGLIELSRDILGLRPEDVGGMGSKAAFARSLVERCVEIEAVEALYDAAQAVKGGFDPKVQEQLARVGARHDLHAGDVIGPFTVVRKIGDGPCATVYVAQRDGRELDVKVIHRDVTRSAPAFARFAATWRLAGRIKNEGVPAAMTVDVIDGVPVVSYEHVEGQTMAARTARSGPMHINEARSILRGILE